MKRTHRPRDRTERCADRRLRHFPRDGDMRHELMRRRFESLDRRRTFLPKRLRQCPKLTGRDARRRDQHAWPRPVVEVIEAQRKPPGAPRCADALEHGHLTLRHGTHVGERHVVVRRIDRERRLERRGRGPRLGVDACARLRVGQCGKEVPRGRGFRHARGVNARASRRARGAPSCAAPSRDRRGIAGARPCNGSCARGAAPSTTTPCPPVCPPPRPPGPRCR